MTPDRPTRRGFLAACSAAAAALGLTARASPARPPIPGAGPPEPRTWCIQETDSTTTTLTLLNSDSGYTSPPKVVLSGGGGSGAPRTWSTLGFDRATRTETVMLREGEKTFTFTRTPPDYRLRLIAMSWRTASFAAPGWIATPIVTL